MRRRFLNNIKSISSDNGEYFTIEALEDGLTVSLSKNTCEYRIDNGSWISLNANTNTSSINKGQTIQFRITNPTISSSSGIGTFTISNKCNLKGNIMSLLCGDNFEGQIDLTGYDYAFYKLFYNCKTIVDVSELLLIATTLANNCYYSMFQGCSSLTTAPELPVTTLVYCCYSSMFKGCTSLTTAPELPATTLAKHCYSSMFYGCTSLTTAPELPATTLVSNCYFSMFEGCTSLTTAPELTAEILVEYCYYGMFEGCTSLTTALELPATTLAQYCYHYMFKGCTNLTTAPELLATTLAPYCYSYMFQGCNKLNYIKMLATDISANSCLDDWVSGVAKTGTFVKDASMTSLPSGVNGIPNGWTVEDYYVDYTSSYFTIEALEDGLTVSLSRNASEYRIDNGDWTTLSADTNTPSINKGQKISFKITNPTIKSIYGLGTFTVNKAFNVEGNIMSLLYGDNFIGQTNLSGKKNVFNGLFNNCTTLQNAENLILPATTLANNCYESMFSGCRRLTTAPIVLPATTLAERCYYHMFSYCNSLTIAPELPATKLVDDCYAYMFHECYDLNYIKMLATDISASGCLKYWVYGVASIAHTGTFVKNAAMTSLPSGSHGIPTGWTVVNDGEESGGIDYHAEYFTIEALEDGLTVSLSQNASHYRIDNGSWNNLSVNTSTPIINKGQQIQFKIDNPTILSSYGIGTFTISKKCNLKGNIMSLLYGDDFIDKNDLTDKDYAFYSLFRNCTKIVDASELILPATTLANYCYYYMFRGCTRLTTAPELPATTLASSCYYSMFEGCTSLTTAPELPATTLDGSCYNGMFKGCTSLTTVPELPATKLASSCYYSMFEGCTSLTTAPELLATKLASSCYDAMFYGTNVLPDCSNIDFTNEAVVASGGLKGLFRGTKVTDADLERILPKNNEGKYCLPTTTLANYCYNGMFKDCTSLTTAPELPATTLVWGCYSNMFQNCSKLNYIKMLAIKINESNCLSSWVNGVASKGTFVKNAAMTTLPSGNNGIPSGWTVINN